MPYKNIADMVFGRLTAIKPVGKDKNGKTLWQCVCACGGEIERPIGALLSGNTKSCGCGRHIGFMREIEKKKKEAFGIHHVRARNSWRHMIDRCTNPENKHFKDYGGRGILVCERWMALKLFVIDMGDPPDGMTLDRWPNKNGNYELNNCRWATPKQQARNTRRNVLAWLGNELLCVAEISERTGVNHATLRSRIDAQMRCVEQRISGAL